MNTFIKVTMVLFMTLLVIGCEKYDRDNPNDELNEGDGSPKLSFASYTVTKDSGGDMLIQKGENATVALFIKNDGSKLTTLKEVVITSSNLLITNVSFKMDVEPKCYVGKDNMVGNLSFTLSSAAKPGDILPLSMKLTDTKGVVTYGEVKVIVNDVSQGVFQITNKDLSGYDDNMGMGGDYCAAFAPRLYLSYKNTSDKTHTGKIKYIINSTDPQYPYHFEMESPNSSIDPGVETSEIIQMDCINASFHKNQNLTFSITILDNKGGATFSELVVPMLPDVANITFKNPSLASSFTGGEPFHIYLDLNNATSSRTLRVESITVTSNSSFVQDLDVLDQKVDYMSPGNNVAQAFRVYGKLAGNCPSGVQITFTATVNLYPTNCGPAKKFTYQFTGLTQ